MDSDVSAVVAKAREGWIPAHIYNDAEIFDLERERVFGRSWQFLAHASEVPDPGDYVVRKVLDDSFIVVRGEDGVVRALFNMCLHRGMQICRAELGNASHFRCPYHAWSYKNDGKLIGVPFHRDAYGGEEGLARTENALLQAPATEIVNGMIFVSLDPDAMPLAAYLGDYAEYLDFYTAPTAEGIVVRGPQRWRARKNWKIGAENFSGDTYHTPHTHASMSEIGITAQAKASSRKGGMTYNAGRGLGAMFGLDPGGDLATKLAAMGYAPEQIRNRERHWPESIRRVIVEDSQIPSASTIFPNLSFLHIWATIDDQGTVAPFTTIRLWQPVSESETEIMSWFAADADADPELVERSYKAYMMCFGSSGMFEQDDMENWVSLTQTAKGQMARRLLLNGRMGLNSDDSHLEPPVAGFAGPGTAWLGFTEHNQRHWLSLWCDAVEPAGSTAVKARSAR
ncbi:MAG TPA: Rieske 2Fe-2S domain-containing protein [Solirubrobacterales bacterium]|jgi:phenylpropionate dioxygenase-like ring-hydroxylating dioxygenase large terminal subunit